LKKNIIILLLIRSTKKFDLKKKINKYFKETLSLL